MNKGRWSRSKLLQGLAWLGFASLLFFVFIQVGSPQVALIRAVCIVLIQAALFYMHLDYMLPELFEKKRYGSYVVMMTLMVVAALADAELIEWGIRKSFPEEEIVRIGLEQLLPPDSVRFVGRILMMFNPYIVSALLRSSILLRRRNEEQQELRHRVMEAETSALRSQINPHFLFNSLNNIYTLSQLKAPQTGKAILQLSALLRYVIYDSNAKLVPLEGELNYIRSYIELQLLKDEAIEQVHYRLPDTANRLRIAPMMLIPFIENSFKHSKFEDLDRGWIRIELELKGRKLVMVVRNSIPEVPFQKDRLGGVGLENVRRRLGLIYPDAHRLEVKQLADEYRVKLEIELEEEPCN